MSQRRGSGPRPGEKSEPPRLRLDPPRRRSARPRRSSRSRRTAGRLRLLLVLTGVVALVVVITQLAASSPPRAVPVPVSVTQTDGKLGQYLARLAPLGRSAGPGGSGETIRIGSPATRQPYWGVGAAITDSSASLIHELPATTQSRLLTTLYGRSGLGLSFGAIPIGASDYTASGRPYTYDDLPAGQVDPQLRHFSVGHDESWDLPVLRAIVRVAPRIRFFATTWTAPPWMKANDRYDDIAFSGSLLPRYYASFAAYLVDWIKAYRARGVNVAAIAPENEPNSPSTVPAMYLPFADQVKFIAGDLAPALRRAGLSTQVSGGDVGMPRLDEQRALIASAAGGDLGGLAWHCYSAPPTQLLAAEAADPALTQLITECAEKLSRVPLQVDVLGALSNGASGFSAWNLALTPTGGPVQLPNRGCAGCRGLVSVDLTRGSYALSEEAYVLGQIGRAVQPGAVRLSSSDEPTWFRHGGSFGLDADSGILNVAYRNPDGRTALITYNASARSRRVTVSDGSHHFVAALPPGAMTTFAWS